MCIIRNINIDINFREISLGDIDLMDSQIIVQDFMIKTMGVYVL
jgi:hypothetical protein